MRHHFSPDKRRAEGVAVDMKWQNSFPEWRFVRRQPVYGTRDNNADKCDCAACVIDAERRRRCVPPLSVQKYSKRWFERRYPDGNLNTID